MGACILLAAIIMILISEKTEIFKYHYDLQIEIYMILIAGAVISMVIDVTGDKLMKNDFEE